jgi:hypothetical protein
MFRESASIRQPHWHRHLPVKRPNRRTGFLAADFAKLGMGNALLLTDRVNFRIVAILPQSGSLPSLTQQWQPIAERSPSLH